MESPVPVPMDVTEAERQMVEAIRKLHQPRDASRSLQNILRSEGIGARAVVGCAGWKYYEDPHRMDTPSYIVDTVRDLAGADLAVDATDLFVHPAWGLRTTCSADHCCSSRCPSSPN